MGPYRDPRKTGKPGPGILMGPYKNRKIGTLQKPENRDQGPYETLPGPYLNRKTGTWDPSKTLAGPYKNRDLGPFIHSFIYFTSVNRETGTSVQPSENLKSGTRYRHGSLRLEKLVLM